MCRCQCRCVGGLVSKRRLSGLSGGVWYLLLELHWKLSGLNHVHHTGTEDMRLVLTLRRICGSWCRTQGGKCGAARRILRRVHGPRGARGLREKWCLVGHQCRDISNFLFSHFSKQRALNSQYTRHPWPRSRLVRGHATSGVRAETCGRPSGNTRRLYVLIGASTTTRRRMS